MAERKGSLLAKSVQKHAGRAKEKVSPLTFSFFALSFLCMAFDAAPMASLFIRKKIRECVQINTTDKFWF